MSSNWLHLCIAISQTERNKTLSAKKAATISTKLALKRQIKTGNQFNRIKSRNLNFNLSQHELGKDTVGHIQFITAKLLTSE